MSDIVEEFVASAMDEFDRVVSRERDLAVRELLQRARPYVEAKLRKRIASSLIKVLVDPDAPERSELVH
jgi:hypothetical protein